MSLNSNQMQGFLHNDPKALQLNIDFFCNIYTQKQILILLSEFLIKHSI